MKKFLIASAIAVTALAPIAASAYTDFSLGVNLGVPGVSVGVQQGYVPPAPVVYGPPVVYGVPYGYYGPHPGFYGPHPYYHDWHGPYGYYGPHGYYRR